MTFDIKRGATWAIVWSALYIPGHLFLMHWLAERYPMFERWNYDTRETWIIGLLTAVMGGIVLAVWKPKS